MKVIKKQKNSRYCIICGMDNQLGVKAQFYEMENGEIYSLFSFNSSHQSYPTRTHGGMISAMLDELIGRVLWIDSPDTYAVTTSLNVKFRKPVPYGENLKGRGYFTFRSEIGFSAKGEIYDEKGNILAKAEGKYLIVSPKQAFGEDVHADEEMIYLIEDGITEINVK